jgi:RNA recognition motif-containing protein
MREGTRSRGVGLVEFETRESLIEGLKRTDKEVYGRKIRVNVSDKTDSHQTDSGRGTFGNQRSNRNTGGEERPEMSGTWKRAERKYFNFVYFKKTTTLKFI